MDCPKGKTGEVKSLNAGKAVTSSVAYASYATASRREALKYGKVTARQKTRLKMRQKVIFAEKTGKDGGKRVSVPQYIVVEKLTTTILKKM